MVDKRKSDESHEKDGLDPNHRCVTERQAKFLAKLTRTDLKKIVGKPIAEVHDILRLHIDPELLFFRRICGRVVKRDPATGALLPVPNATVHVEDTDCSFFGFHPVESPWTWLFPFRCSREVIATVRTDACGRFCVLVPRWDIDRVLRFRLERVCWPTLRKPTLRDILQELPPRVEPPIIRDPRPQPDPAPFRQILSDALTRVSELAGMETAERIEVLVAGHSFGDHLGELNELLDSPAPLRVGPPPLPDEVRRVIELKDTKSLATHVGVTEDLVSKLHFNRYLGPFWRCRTVAVPVWSLTFDVPDITFRVTQDVDGDGNEEEIYSEGFFDVRWNAGPIPPVTLEASGLALATPVCDPVQVECQNQPAIVTAGYMPLTPAYHDNATGYGLRVNRPRPPNGLSGTAQSGLAHAPYALTLNLHGCHRLKDATHYRLTYSYQGGPVTPFRGINWYAPRLGPGGPIFISPDADGWYPILPAANLAHPHWLLPWPTHNYANGRYEVRLELGKPAGGSIGIVDTSGERVFMVDNSLPALDLVEIRWRPASVPVATPWNDATSTLLPAVCPVITRPAGQDIHLRVTWSASATHLLYANLQTSGCGGGGFMQLSPEDTSYHWYVNSTDNVVNGTALFELPGDRLPGCYHVAIDAYERSMNPSGFDHGPINDWFVNQYLHHARISRSISLVNV